MARGRSRDLGLLAGRLHPGGSLEKVCHVVWLAEAKDVAKNIAVLAAPEGLPASCG